MRLVLLFRTCDWPIYWPLIERLLTAPRTAYRTVHDRLLESGFPGPAYKLSFFEVIFMLQYILVESFAFCPFSSFSLSLFVVSWSRSQCFLFFCSFESLLGAF